MKTEEILLLIAYMLVVSEIAFYNYSLIRKLKDLTLNELEDTLFHENFYIKSFTISAIVSVPITYNSLSLLAFLLFLIQTLVLVYSLNKLKRSLLAQIKERL